MRTRPEILSLPIYTRVWCVCVCVCVVCVLFSFSTSGYDHTSCQRMGNEQRRNLQQYCSTTVHQGTTPLIWGCFKPYIGDISFYTSLIQLSVLSSPKDVQKIKEAKEDIEAVKASLGKSNEEPAAMG